MSSARTEKMHKHPADLSPDGGPNALSATKANVGVHRPARAAPEAELRQVTVVACELMDSGTLAARLGPEELCGVVGSFQACCERATERFGGHAIHHLGDYNLVCFGYPRSYEHGPERAVRAALALVSAVGEIGMHQGFELRTRVGVATGEVVAGDLAGIGRPGEETIVGEAPYLAARLMRIAEPDGVVLADGTRRLLGGSFKCKDTGLQTLSAFDEPVRVWQLLGERPVESRFQTAHPNGTRTPLIGREEEVELIGRRWEQARAGEGQVVLLVGEPGIGKARLAQTASEGLHPLPHTTLRLCCSPCHQSEALFPVTSGLERAAGLAPQDTPDVKLDKLEALVARVAGNDPDAAPFLAALLSVPTGNRYPACKLSPQRQQTRTLETLEGQLADLAARQPVVVVLESLHWADTVTVELLAQVVERVETTRVLLLVTCRPELLPPWIGRPHVTTFMLSRLNRSEIGAMARSLAGGKALPAAALAQIASRTDGVPLFVEELTKTVLQEGALQENCDHYALIGPLPQVAIPSTLRDALMARLDRLGPAREVAQIAATLGRQFSFELLSALSPLPDAELRDALRKLTEADLIDCRGAPPQATYTFRHALVQETAYNTMLGVKRQALQEQIARVREGGFPQTLKTRTDLQNQDRAEAKTLEEMTARGEKLASAHAPGQLETTPGPPKDLPDSP